jgi:flagellar biosynthesis component FlhA
MKLTDYIKRLIRDYFIIFAIVVICITVLRQIFSPDEYFELKDIFIYMICSLVADLASLILYSRKDIPEKEMRLRIIIHFVVLEAVLLTLTNVMGWVAGIPGTIILAFQIAVIYVLVGFLSWRDDKKTAHKINEKLKAMKDESRYGPEEE